MMSTLGNINLAQIGIAFLFFFIFGYLLYASLFAAIGSGVENEGDSSQLQLPVTIPLIQNLGIEIRRGKNMHQFRSKVYICMAVGNVAISIPLGMRWGGLGCALGTAISLLIGNGLVMNLYYHKRIGLDMLRFWKSILSMLPGMAIPAALGIAAVRLYSFAGYGGVLLFALPYTAVYCASVWRLSMNESERMLLKTSVLRHRNG